MVVEISDKFWADDPMILINPDRLLEFFVTKDQTISEKLNSIVRFGAYSAIILSLYKNDIKYLFLSIIAFALTYFLWNTSTQPDITVTPEEVSNVNKNVVKPTVNNPFSNPTLISGSKGTDVAGDYHSYNEESLQLKKEVNDAFGAGIFNDFGDDLYGKNNSQRQFYSVPDPFDTNGDFKKFLYSGMNGENSCKVNTFACAKNNYEALQAKRPIYGNPLVDPTISK
jgi:hypothetical protein